MFMATAVASIGLPGCDLGDSEECPSGAVEVRPFAGPAVTENRLECSGLPCSLALGDNLFTATTEGCGREVLRFGLQSAFYARYFDVYLDPESDDATAWFVMASDVGDPRLYDVQSGWIALERWEEDIVVGRFEFEVAPDHSARGDFDTRIDPFE